MERSRESCYTSRCLGNARGSTARGMWNEHLWHLLPALKVSLQQQAAWEVTSPLLCLCSSEPRSQTVSGEHLEGDTVVSTSQLLPRKDPDSIPGRRAVFCSLAHCIHFKATGGGAMLKEGSDGTQHNRKWKPCVLILRWFQFSHLLTRLAWNK